MAPSRGPLVVTCCSFKGGAGRSTAAANIATALMMNGQHVLLLDADFRAPGLHELFWVFEPRLSTAVQPGGRNEDGLQHLFNEFKRGEGFVTERARAILRDRVFLLREKIATKATSPGLRKRILESEGELVFLPASTKTPAMPWADVLEIEAAKEYAQRYDKLLPPLNQFITPKLGFDFIVIDAPSGNGPQSAPAHEIAKYLLVFYRQSLQHSFGTVDMVNKFIDNRTFRGPWRGKQFMCIPSCVENRANISASPDIIASLEEYNQHVEAAFMSARVPRAIRGDCFTADPERQLYISDEPTMRIFERVVMGEAGHPLAHQYERIARYLIDNRDPDANGRSN